METVPEFHLRGTVLIFCKVCAFFQITAKRVELSLSCVTEFYAVTPVRNTCNKWIRSLISQGEFK